MTLHQFLLILRARYRIAVVISLVCILGALLISLLMTKTYTAETAVLVDVRTPDPISGGGAQSSQVASAYMATQVDIISGDRVAKRVVSTLKLDEDPEARKEWMEATEGRGSLQEWLAESLQRRLVVRPARESNVISIIYQGFEPESTANITNAFAQSYLDINLALKTEPARIYAEWFDEQTKASRAKLEEAQARLSDYQQRAGLVSSGEVDYETARLGEISSQLTAVQGETTNSQSKRAAGGDTLAEVMQSPLINSLKADVARMDAKVQEVAVNLGPNHPQRRAMESELAALRGRLAAETRRITSSIDTAYQVGRDRERDLQRALSEQKARVMALNKQRDELNVYRRDVEAAQRAYEDVSKSASQTRLQSLTNQTNVVRLNTAVAPLKPSSPKLLLNLLIAAFGGTLLGLATALIIELANRRVRSVEDLVHVLDLPVLARISTGSTGEGQGRLSGGPGLLALGNGRPA
jgi:polysaccharide biosynthesis transport protein